jgi:WD40 repeat protein/tRNA A-37 threonylcarbamoyl transferase component Bud32
MTADSARQGLLEAVLGEYMERLDRGETVDRKQLLARYPELAEELQSYFAASEEVELLGRKVRKGSLTEPFAPAATESASLVEGKVGRFGDYELLGQIGEGGMGVIYKARQVSLQRLVALKMIRADRLASPSDDGRFRSEAEAAASLDHPHIVPIYEVDEHHGQPFFSMKLIEGDNLAQQLPGLAADLPAGVGLLAVVARAVHYAHQRGLLHRDLKPANILLDAQGRPHITDFGLAKRLGPRSGEASLTQQGMIVGTPSYMAPEQATSTRGVSTAADVYSLGAILYELLTGRPPFRAETPLETIVQLLEQEPVPPRRLNKHVDHDLETICLKCLHKEPAKRYASAELLADDLERWQRGEPIQARPVGLRERGLLWARRRPHLAALSALLVLALVAGIAGVCWQWQRAEGEYHKASALADTERRTAYTRAIALAYAEWRAGNAGLAEQVLNGCPPELRGWEWHYLRRLFRVRQLGTLQGHADGVLAVAFSPDGKHVASAGADAVVTVWDRQTLRAVLALRGHEGAVTAVAFSRDGKHLASGAAGTVRIWDVNSGKNLATWQGHEGKVTGLAFDPTPRAGGPPPAWRLASTGGKPSGGELKLWEPDGQALTTRVWPNLLAGVAFRSDGKWLATAGHDGSVTAWDRATLEPIQIFKGQTERIVPWASVAFSADGRWITAGSPDGLVRVWDTTSAREVFSVLPPTQAGVSGLTLSGPAGRILAAATTDNTVQGWFTRSGKPAFTLRGHTRLVTSVACSPDGRCLASGSLDRTVKLWDIDRRDEDLTLRPANEGVTSVACSPDGVHLVAATRDRAVKVWEATGNTILTIRRLPATVNRLAFNSDGRLFASAGDDGIVRLWDLAGKEVAVLRGHVGRVAVVSFRPDGAALASTGADGTVRIWEVESRREGIRLSDPGVPVHALAFSPDGRRLAAAGEDGVVRVWDSTTGQNLLTLDPCGAPIYAMSFSPDGRHLATAGQDEVIRVLDGASGALVRTLRGHAGAVRGLVFGPGGRLASVGDDRAVRLWNTAGQELLALRGHTDILRAVVFSRDGTRLVSASDDGTVKVWDGTPLEGME